MKKNIISFALMAILIILSITGVSAADNSSIPDIAVLDVLYSNGKIDTYNIPQNPLISDQEQIITTINYLYGMNIIKEIITVNGVKIAETEYYEHIEKLKNAGIDKEGQYKGESDLDLIERSKDNKIVPTEEKRQNIPVEINGNILTGLGAYAEQGRTMVPVRAVSEALGANVIYYSPNPLLKIVTIRKGAIKIDMMVGDYRAFKDGEAYIMDVSPKVIDDTIFVPARYLSELLHFNIEYIEKSNKIVITGGGSK